MRQKARKKIGIYFFNDQTLNQFLKKWVKIKFFFKNPPSFFVNDLENGFPKWKFQHSVKHVHKVVCI